MFEMVYFVRFNLLERHIEEHRAREVERCAVFVLHVCLFVFIFMSSGSDQNLWVWLWGIVRFVCRRSGALDFGHSNRDEKR
jgi:hypothetical protein